MVPISCQIGTCSCFAQYSVVLSDEDGADIVQLFKDEIDGMMGSPGLFYTPVPFYVTMGTIGNLHAEFLVLFLYAGIPFIMSSAFSIDGAGLSDAIVTREGGRLVSRLYAENNRNVYSLGYIQVGENPLEYARDYLEHSPPIASPDIDMMVAEEHIVNAKMNHRVGVISRDGGTRLEIYALDTDESRMIRANKDFGDDPYMERGIPVGMVEVVAYGGMPDIISIGSVCSADGSLFEVWVPNAPGLTSVARNMFEDGVLPLDAFTLDTDGVEECYARFHGKLREMEDEAIDREIEAETDEETPPSIYDDNI
jgi:hypothetical protein